MVISNLTPNERRPADKKGHIVVIDHSAMACFGAFDPDTCGILTIGDDTTSICGHIGCFRGMPILGITDGDIDGVPEGYAPEVWSCRLPGKG